jgi:hypothetical protein
MGSHSPFSGLLVICIYLSNYWSEHWFLFVIHCIFGFQQRGFCVRVYTFLDLSGFDKNLTIISRKWGIPQLTLSAYLQFWSVVCYAVTLWLLFFKKEASLVLCVQDYSIFNFL